MKEVGLKNVEIRRLLNWLETYRSRVFKKTWRLDTRIIAIFIEDEFVFRTMSRQTLTTIVEYDTATETGKATIIASGGKNGLFQLDWGSEKAGENSLARDIKLLLKIPPTPIKHSSFACIKTRGPIAYKFRWPS